MTTQTEEAPRIEAEVWDEDRQVVVYFTWDHRNWGRGVRMDVRDGRAVLWLDIDAARELRRKLEVLDKQDFADAGHPDSEDVQEEADVRREAIENR